MSGRNHRCFDAIALALQPRFVFLFDLLDAALLGCGIGVDRLEAAGAFFLDQLAELDVRRDLLFGIGAVDQAGKTARCTPGPHRRA